MNRRQLLIVGIGIILAVLQDNLNFGLGPIPPHLATEFIALAVAGGLGWSMVDGKEDGNGRET